MKKLATLVLLISAAGVEAKDFRALDFGDSCKDLVKAEEALGSRYTGAPAEKSLFAFQGSFQGWPAIVGYSCRDGRFHSGSYLLGRTSLSEAKEFYAQLKRQLILEHGEPTTDFASPEAQRKLEESLGRRPPETDRYSCMWDKEKLHVQLSMNGPFGGEGWETSVTFEALGGI